MNNSASKTTIEDLAADQAKPDRQSSIPLVTCQFGKDKDGNKLTAEMDIVKYDLLCGGQEFSEDFCRCDMSD